MKTFLCSAVGLAFCVTALLHAQPSPDPFAAPQPSEIQEEIRFNLRFPGGTLNDLIQSIANEITRPPNIIAGTHARELEVPPFELYSVTVDDVLTALDRIWNVSVRTHHASKTKDGIWTFENPMPSERVPDEPFAVRAGNAAEPASPPQLTRTFQLSLILERYRIDDVITAIETALGVDGGEAGVLRYHEETKLLFIRGTREHLILVEHVMRELQDIPEPPELRAARAHLRELLSVGLNPEYPVIQELLEEIRGLERQRLERGGAGSNSADSE